MLGDISQYQTLCNAKVETSKYNTPSPTYKELMKEYLSTNNVKHNFWFCTDDFKRCINGNKKVDARMACNTEHMVSK